MIRRPRGRAGWCGLGLAGLLMLALPAWAGGDRQGSWPAVPTVTGFGIPEALRVLEAARQPQIVHQLRVEQRMVVRIAPSSDATRARLMAELPRRPLREAFEEVPHADCVALDSLAGVQPMQGNRLLLFTSQRQVLAVSLDRACNADAFYSGFYVEGTRDGRLCAARDRLHSRAGATCQVAGFTRLVAVRD